MAAPAPSNAPGLYVHVPFCSAICNYCNFNRGLFDEALARRFVEALLDEIRAGGRAWDADPPDTLYFGGGTPSLLAPAGIAAIVGEARRAFGLQAGAEITLEANPESVDASRLAGFREAGVTRLSFGVQSFRDDELQRLGRLHSARRARDAAGEARAAGFDNVSLDLMMWLPGQDVSAWLASVEEAVLVAPEHLSLYMLEVYPHLPLRQEIDRQGWRQAPDEDAAEMYEAAMARLDAAGYEQYEISNVSRPGRRSRHNLKYWTDGEWLGFGPGAHSTWRGSRWRNLSSTDEYVTRVQGGGSPIVDRRRLSDEERLGDALMMGLRLNEGIDVAILSRRYATDITGRFEGRLAPFVEGGILSIQDGRWKLTRQGMLLANEVLSVFV